jgi:HAD superfamily hydrolase (TIGR01509 family)
MIKAILMDFAGVVSKNGTLFNELATFVKLPKEELEKKYHLAKVGKISNDKYMSYVPKEGWDWYFNYVTIHHGIKEFFTENKLPIYLTSNHVSSLIQPQLDSLDVRENFKEIFVSDKLKLAKPNKEFYEFVLNKINLNADEVIIIDDQKKNLIIPKKMGMKTIWVNNQSGFGEDNNFTPDAEIYNLSKLNKIIVGLCE